MIQISFQPAFDPYHAVFRFLRIQKIVVARDVLHFDVIRILDFFLLFPFRIGRIRLKPEHRKFRRLATDYKDREPYGELPDDRIVFDRMEPFQFAALQSLKSHGYLKSNDLDFSSVSVAANPPKELADRIQAINKRDETLLDFLGVLASQYELRGRDGLKDRADLLDYRYDAI